MSAPTEFSVNPTVASPFGPDESVTPEHPPKDEKADTRRGSRRTTSSSDKKDANSFLGGLGKNSPARSSVRQLTEEDRAALAGYYTMLGRISKPFRPALGAALEEQSDECAQSWMGLARKNVKVRSALLALLEGGEISKVIAAHLPIIVAALPEEFVTRFLLKFGAGLFSQEASEGQPE